MPASEWPSDNEFNERCGVNLSEAREAIDAMPVCLGCEIVCSSCEPQLQGIFAVGGWKLAGGKR